MRHSYPMQLDLVQRSNGGCYGAATHINAFIEKLLAMAKE